MKKIGDLFTALGVVAFGFFVLEMVMEWKMIPDSIVIPFLIISLVVLLVGIVVRSIGKSKEAKKNSQNGK